MSVDVTPPDIPATRCSYLMWLNNALEDDEVGFFIVDMTNLLNHSYNF